jgi:uncharacterized protein (DUF305 family)
MAKPTVNQADISADISDATLRRVLLGVVWGVAAILAVTSLTFGVLYVQEESARTAPLNATELGFLQDMIDHHEQALLLSNIYLAESPKGEAAPYAKEVLIYQKMEISQMETFLKNAKQQRGAVDRMTMEWMGMGMPVGQMEGMQPPDKIALLKAARGAEADRLFFVLMTAHHRGGISMAVAARKGTNHKKIGAFQDMIAKNQRIEINEYNGAMKRLGLTA